MIQQKQSAIDCVNLHKNWGLFYINQKLSLSSKFRTNSLRRCDVKFCLQEKSKEFAK